MQTWNPATTVYQFSDFRSFLADHAAAKRKANPSWSLGAWARTLGLKGTASLSRVIQGTRQPGPEMSVRLAQYFDFSANERDFFENLILLDKVKEDSSLSVLVMEKLKSLHPKRQFKLLDHRTFSAISNWYFYVLREMVRMRGFQEDGQWIARKLHYKVTPRQISEAIETMISIGLLARDEQGMLVQSEPRVETPNDVASEASRRNHEQNLENAKWALRNIPVEEREFGSNCFTLSSMRMPEAKKLIREFRMRFQDLLEEPVGEGDITCQLQVQLFPFTKLNSRGSNYETQ